MWGPHRKNESGKRADAGACEAQSHDGRLKVPIHLPDGPTIVGTMPTASQEDRGKSSSRGNSHQNATEAPNPLRYCRESRGRARDFGVCQGPCGRDRICEWKCLREYPEYPGTKLCPKCAPFPGPGRIAHRTGQAPEEVQSDRRSLKETEAQRRAKVARIPWGTKDFPLGLNIRKRMTKEE